MPVINWIRDPKNRGIIKLAAIAILIMIILMQCSQNRGLRADVQAQKNETTRITNNYEALHDTIRQGKVNDSTILAERLALKLTLKELKEGYSDLLIGFEQFKKQNPKVIERFTVTNNETIREVPIYAKMDSLGNGELAFSDSIKYPDGNSRTLTGSIKYKSRLFTKKDSLEADINKLGLYNTIQGGVGNFKIEQKMKLTVGLFEDPKTKKVTIAVKTSYPGITFSQLEGADIMNDETSRNVAKKLRKTWGIGIQFGYGAAVDLKTSKIILGPQIGVGIHYTPNFLQWGK
jgi:hypothetical protein